MVSHPRALSPLLDPILRFAKQRTCRPRHPSRSLQESCPWCRHKSRPSNQAHRHRTPRAPTRAANRHAKDELALLIAERSVVFFLDQDITPQQQKQLGEYFGLIEVHPQGPQVPEIPGVTAIWPDLQIKEGRKANFRQPGGASMWHTDLVHEAQPAGVTHLHNDIVPESGGDTLWSSGKNCRA